MAKTSHVPRDRIPIPAARLRKIAAIFRDIASAYELLSNQAAAIEPVILKAGNWRQLEIALVEVNRAMKEHSSVFQLLEFEKIFGHPKEPARGSVVASAADVEALKVADEEVAAHVEQLLRSFISAREEPKKQSRFAKPGENESQAPKKAKTEKK